MVNSKIRNGIILFMVLAAMLVTGCGGSHGDAYHISCWKPDGAI